MVARLDVFEEVLAVETEDRLRADFASIQRAVVIRIDVDRVGVKPYFARFLDTVSIEIEEKTSDNLPVPLVGGGEVDRIFSLDQMSREEALDEAKTEATNKALGAGADSNTVQIVDVEEVPLSYLPGNATRIMVKAVGDLATT